MPKASAGLLVYRETAAGLEVMLLHPGGPFWKTRQAGAWSIPKGEVSPDEDLLVAARREAREETGADFPGEALPLGCVKQAGGKRVHAWAVRGELDPSRLSSNTFELEWPPRSGKRVTFPEVDEARWVDLPEARRLLVPAQAAFLDRLEEALAR